MTDQTPEARLAAALHGADLALLSAQGRASDYKRWAAAVLAADPTLAADLALAEKVRESDLVIVTREEAALAAAVREMGDAWLVDHSAPEQGIDVRIWTYDEADGDTEHRGSGPTLTAAIKAAKEASE